MCGAIEEENFWVNAAPYRTASLGAVESHKRENRINKASRILLQQSAFLNVCYLVAYQRRKYYAEARIGFA